MFSWFYDKVVVEIHYKDNVGSGILISDVSKKHSFLISAKHCFGEEKDIGYEKIEVYREETAIKKKMNLNFYDKIIIEQDDIIVFEIDYLNDLPQYYIIKPEGREDVTMVGFPRGLDIGVCLTSRHTLRGQVNALPNDSIVQITMRNSFETNTSDASSNMSGYSGGGIFVEIGEIPCLCGIVTNLGSPEGLFSFINGKSMLKVDMAINQKKGLRLPDIRWCGFEKYEDKTLAIFEDSLKYICSMQLPEITKNVTPGNILDHCGNKIVWPYSNKTIYQREVWEEWLLYLIIRCIENRENLENENYYVINNDGNKRKVKVLYVTNHTTLPYFYEDYLKNVYQDISSGQIMIIKTVDVPGIKKISAKSMEKIVNDISRGISMDNHIRIDEVENNIRKISVVHINALVDEMASFILENEDLLNLEELEQELGKRVREILYEL